MSIDRSIRMAVFGGLILFSVQAPAREKMSLAILDFTAKNMKQESAEAVTDILRTAVFKTGRFQVVERQRIQSVLEEQRLQSTGLTDEERVVHIGKLLNVNKIMIGTVNVLGGLRVINVEIVDVETGLVDLAESAEAGSDAALVGAVDRLVFDVAFKVGLEGNLIKIEKSGVYIDMGGQDGLNKGHVFQVIRKGKPITDLEGKVIGTVDEIIAALEITDVYEQFSIAKVKRRSKALQVGDRVIPPDDPQNVKLGKRERSTVGKVEVPIIF